MPMKESSSGQKIFNAELLNRYMSSDSCPGFITESQFYRKKYFLKEKGKKESIMKGGLWVAKRKRNK